MRENGAGERMAGRNVIEKQKNIVEKQKGVSGTGRIKCAQTPGTIQVDEMEVV